MARDRRFALSKRKNKCKFFKIYCKGGRRKH